MRYFIAVMTLCCGSTVGYANEAQADEPEEIVIIDVETGNETSEEVAIGIDSNKSSAPKKEGCGCGRK